MKKALKYILVFGLPAAICGTGWLIGFIIGLLVLAGKIPDGRFTLGLLWFCAACSVAALFSSFCWHRLWLRSRGVGQNLGLALAHQLCGTAFSACIGGAINSLWNHEKNWLWTALMGSILCAGVNLVFTPIQLPIAYLHLRLFRFLHARFLAPHPVG